MKEIQQAVRRLSRTRTLTVAVVLCTALGVGAVTAAFSAVQGVLLRPLPYREPDRLAMVWERLLDGTADGIVVSYRNFVDWRQASQSFESMAAYNIWFPGRTGVEQPEKLLGAQVDPAFFDTLGVRPALGRVFTAEEALPNASGVEPVVILSHDYWRNHFGGDSSVLERTIELDGVAYRIVGVMEPDFRQPEPIFLQDTTQLWTPLVVPPQIPRSVHSLRVVARLKPGVSLEAAGAEMDAVARRLAAEYPADNKDLGVHLVPLHEELLGDYRTALLVLLAAAGLVLLIACANVSSLLLAGAAGRSREVAVRLALGAAKGRLVRQALTEALLLTLAGGALGLLLGNWGVRGLLALTPQPIPRADEIGVDALVVAFAVGVCLVTALLAGTGPALRAAQGDPGEALQEGGRRSSGGRKGGRFLGMLVVLELALSLPLLLGAGLLARSLSHLEEVPLGFRPDGVLTLRFELLPHTYPGGEELVAFYRRVLDELGNVPGVTAVGTTSSLPLTGLYDMTLTTQLPGTVQEHPTGYRLASPGYFSAFGIPVVAGREFTPQDDAESAPVAIVNRSLAQTLWPGENPVGRKVNQGTPNGFVEREVIGVVGDVRHSGPSAPARPEIFAPVLQSPVRFTALVVRTEQDPASAAPAVLEALRRLDPRLVVSGVQPMGPLVDESLAAPRFRLILAGVLAGVALVLAALGLYGLTSYTVGLRTREMGIRAALGAARGTIFTGVLRRSLALAVAGVALGLAGAWPVSRFLASLLYGVEVTDAATFAVAPLVLLAVAALAAALPAGRAARVDPMVALREE